MRYSIFDSFHSIEGLRKTGRVHKNISGNVKPQELKL